MATFTGEQRELYDFAINHWVLRKDRSFSEADYVYSRQHHANKPPFVARRTIASLVRRGYLKRLTQNGNIDENRYTVTSKAIAIQIRRLERDSRAYERFLRQNGRGRAI